MRRQPPMLRRHTYWRAGAPSRRTGRAPAADAGQVVPAQVGSVEVCVDGAETRTVPIDDAGWFEVRLCWMRYPWAEDCGRQRCNRKDRSAGAALRVQSGVVSDELEPTPQTRRAGRRSSLGTQLLTGRSSTAW